MPVVSEGGGVMVFKEEQRYYEYTTTSIPIYHGETHELGTLEESGEMSGATGRRGQETFMDYMHGRMVPVI